LLLDHLSCFRRALLLDHRAAAFSDRDSGWFDEVLCSDRTLVLEGSARVAGSVEPGASLRTSSNALAALARSPLS